MTQAELIDIVYNELTKAVSMIQGGLGNVPKKSGNLRNSIKVVMIGPTQFQVYLDETMAPYAEKINENNAFWNRVYHQISYKLAGALGTMGSKQ